MATVWRPTRSFVFDATVMLTCVALEVIFTVIALLTQPKGTVMVTTTFLIWAVQLTADVSLLVRRRFPLLVLGLAIIASVPVVAAVLGLVPAPSPIHTDPWIPASLPIAAYSAVVYARNRQLTWTLVGLLAVMVAQPWQLSKYTVGTSVTLALVPSLLGMYIAARRRLIHALTDRAERAEREQLLLAEQARTQERVRLASEMHDVVSHRVSLMVLQAGAVRVATTDPATRTVAEEMRLAGSQALEELRDLIGVLRTAPHEEPPRGEVTVADLPDLAGLVAESRSVGVSVELVTDGDPAQVTAAVGRTAYRVVQEALTNVRKHAPGAEARVRVRYGGDKLTISVHNSQPTGTVDPLLADTGSGTGLAGLRQRVELLSGTLTTGPDEGGGFGVAAVLPRHVPTGDGGRS